MDLIAAKLGANMALKELGISKASAKTYTFDGDMAGKVEGHLTMTMVKVGEAADLNTFTKLSALMFAENIELKKSDLNIIDTEYGQAATWGEIGDAEVLASVTAPYMPEDSYYHRMPEAGLYVLRSDEDSYVSSVDFATEAKPIDPKYLGGVCLPYVEIAEPIPVSEDATFLPIETGAALAAASATKMPCIIKCTIISETEQTLCGVFIFSDVGYMFSLGPILINVYDTSTNGWAVTVTMG